MDLAHFWNTSGAYEIKQSLRFERTDSAYLRRTFGTPTTQNVYTFSTWLKYIGWGTDTFTRSNYKDTWLLSPYQDNDDWGALQVNNDLKFVNYTSDSDSRGTDGGIATNMVVRDPSAWYHVIFVLDATQSALSDRLKIYVNGVKQSVTSVGNPVGQNQTTILNKASTIHDIGRNERIGQLDSNARYFSMMLAETHFVDGQALDATNFGEVDTITGAWIPKKYSGSYGNNGFYLKYDPSATNGIGHDHSGNGNNFTATGFSTSGTGTDVMSDTPTNNWCTLNPLNQDSAFTLSNGNLQLTSTATTGSVGVTSTSAVSSGKWYWEVTRDSWNINCGTGLITTSSPRSSAVTGSGGKGVTYLGTNIYKDGSSVQSGLSQTVDGDVIGIALDLDSSTVQFYKNNSAIGTAVSISAETWTPSFGMDTGGYGANVTTTFNFGQRGAFAYTPPTGYKALNTANLPEPTIKKGSKYFDTVLWTGDGNNRTISGYNFSPDFVWTKSRSNAYSHKLYDAIRGAGKILGSNSTDAETTDTNTLSGFTSSGFSLGTDTGINGSGVTFVGWAWDANGAGSSNTDGTITSTVSANPTAGFSIATYTGTGSNASFGHGLGFVPSMCIIKQRNTAQSWWVWHQALGNNVGANNTMLELNGSAATYAADDVFRGFTSSVVNIGTDSGSNTNGGTYVAYCFSEVAGYSKFGSYTGNGSSDGPFVFCGFRPKFVMFKRTDSTGDWFILDGVRETYNYVSRQLGANNSGAESGPDVYNVDFTANGFKLRNSVAAFNASGGTFIFAAFSETAFKFANAR